MWKITYIQDTEISGVGTATATYTGLDGSEMSYSGRIDNRDGGTIGQFIDEALARYKKRAVVDADTLALIAKIEAVLNEKVGAK